MPHVIVEYSANIEDKIRPEALLKVLQEAAVSTGVAELAGFRCRAARRDHFRVADNHPDNGFIAIYIRVAQGRSAELRRQLTEAAFAAAQKHLEPVYATTPLVMSCEVQEIDPNFRLQYSNIRDWMKTRGQAA
jgi:5-carboxymethyl-2-hydroxymuconate isomerase